MAHVIAINGIHPQQPQFLAPNATLVGDVRCGAEVSVWFGAVIRADINYIHLHDRVNVQDNSVIHVSQARPCIIGAATSLGHNVTAHACVIGARCLLGMNCVVLDGASIGDDCLIAAGAVVGEGMVVPAGHLVAGVPARVVKPLAAELRERMARISGDYVRYQTLYPEIVHAAQGNAS